MDTPQIVKIKITDAKSFNFKFCHIDDNEILIEPQIKFPHINKHSIKLSIKHYYNFKHS